MSSNDPRAVDMPADVITALSQGNKIEAIKRLREARGIGLKEAKDAVDNYAAADPALRRRLDTMQENAKRSLLTYVGLFFGLIALVALFLRFRD